VVGELAVLARLRAHHPYTERHSMRVAAMSVQVGKLLDMDSEDLRDLRQGAILHDVGKVVVPVALLDGTTRLNDREFATIRNHSAAGDLILRSAGFPEATRRIVRGVHERLDGSGYPDGISGDQLAMASRVIAAADAFDAITAPGRNYQSTRTAADAFEILDRSTGTHFDEAVVSALKDVVSDRVPHLTSARL
jgi:putative nucleotidyltransferase with HDIG domain